MFNAKPSGTVITRRFLDCIRDVCYGTVLLIFCSYSFRQFNFLSACPSSKRAPALAVGCTTIMVIKMLTRRRLIIIIIVIIIWQSVTLKLAVSITIIMVEEEDGDGYYYHHCYYYLIEGSLSWL